MRPRIGSSDAVRAVGPDWPHGLQTGTGDRALWVDCSGDWRRTEAIAVVHEAIDLGITFVDTSVYYGSAEERLGKALVGRRDQVVVGTKAGRFGYADFDFSPVQIRQSLEHSLRLLRTEYVDILPAP